ncbi:unnamed protein product, partial [Discosporangium mesarthrocarpum]
MRLTNPVENGLVVRGRRGSDSVHYNPPIEHQDIDLFRGLLITAQRLWEGLDQPFPFGPCISGWAADLLRLLCLAWLGYAAGLLDEAGRVFLGIRLTQGLGTPAAVGRIWSRIAVRGQMVAKDIAVEDFVALSKLYMPEPTQPPPKAPSDETAIASSRLEREDLLMRVSHVSATFRLWSMNPWSNVKRYESIHVRGATISLRQFKGILNFSFLALHQSKQPGDGEGAELGKGYGPDLWDGNG